MTGGNDEELIFESDFMKTLEREGHTQVFVTTHDADIGLYKLQTVEVIVHNYQVTSLGQGTQEVQTVFVSDSPTEILHSTDQMNLLQLTDASISVFTEG